MRTGPGQPGLPDGPARGHWLFEVDTAVPRDLKASVLRQERAVARCERVTVAVDLREDWPGALAAAGHDPAALTAWIAEGPLIHLPGDAVELLLTARGEPAPAAAGGSADSSPGIAEREAELIVLADMLRAEFDRLNARLADIVRNLEHNRITPADRDRRGGRPRPGRTVQERTGVT